MVDDKFGKPDGKRPGDPTEGVRIIGAEEAAEALERGDIAARRGGDSPRYGDRPKPPPVGPRPALRFPLEATADPTSIDKPAVRPTTGIEFEPLAAMGEPSGQRFDPVREPEPEAATPPPAVSEALPPADDEVDIDLSDLRDPIAASDEPATPVEMPHWSDPPTGEVPRVIVGDDAGEDLDAWSSFAASSPRWRDSDRDWEEEGSVHEMLGADAEWRVGAMDDTRPTDHEIYSFENLAHEVPAPAPSGGLDYDDETEWEPEPEPVASGPIAIGRNNAGRRMPPERRNPVADYASGGSGYAPPTGGAGRNLGTAAAVGVGLVAVFLALCMLGPKYALVFVVGALALAAVEYFNAVRKAGYQPATLFGLVATVCCPLAVYWQGFAAYPVLIAVIVMAAMLWHLAGADGEARVVESIGVTLLGIGWIGGLGSFAALMLASPDGVGMLLAAAIATVGYDVGGLFVGRSAGSRPLSEASPNKTVEGLVGGVLVAVVATVAVVGLVGIEPFAGVGSAFIIGLFAALAAPLGDLCESLIKRDLGVKDMGSILPEHGGLLDRFDGILFVLPAVFYAAVFFELGPF